jgi:hypothetical protein
MRASVRVISPESIPGDLTEAREMVLGGEKSALTKIKKGANEPVSPRNPPSSTAQPLPLPKKNFQKLP